MRSRDSWLISIAVIICIAVTFYALRGILLPFIAATIAAYFLDPAADRLERIGLSRTGATLLITSIFFLLCFAGSAFLLPMLYEQLLALIHKLPEYRQLFESKVLPKFLQTLDKIDPHALERLQESTSSLSSQGLSLLGRLVNRIWQSGLAIVNLFSLIFLSPIVTFYMLRDWDKVLERIFQLFPLRYRGDILTQAQAINSTLSGYIRGQTHVCAILGAWYGIGLSLIGLDFGFFLGVMTGLLSFIPYLGFATGCTAALIISFLQFDTYTPIAFVAGVFLVGQIIEGNFLTPILVGDRVGLHPMWMIFSMLAGAALLGITGMLIAVPVAATLGVLIRFFIERYQHSNFYTQS